jgi:DNA-binding SARP family transcriptional activator
LVLIAEVTGRHPRLQAILELGAAFALTAVLHGTWAPGTTCCLTDDATVSRTLGPSGVALTRTRMYAMTLGHARELLAHLAERTHLTNPDPDTAEEHPGRARDNDEGEPGDGEPGDGRDHRENASHGRDSTTAPRQPRPSHADPDTDPDRALRGGLSIDDILNPTPRTPPSHLAEPEHAQPEPAESEPAESEPARPEQVQQEQAGPEEAGPQQAQPGKAEPRMPEPAGPAVSAPGQTPAAITTRPITVLSSAGSRAAPPPVVGSGVTPEDALVVIRALGRLSVHTRTQPGEPLCDITADIPTAQLQLLSYLAARTDPASPDSLMAACWPETPSDKAIHRLYSTASKLRATLRAATSTHTRGDNGEVLTRIAENYQLDPRRCWVDHHALDTTLTDAHAHLASDSDRYHHGLAAAVALYTGPLLATLHHDWIEPLRESTRHRILDAATTLAEHHTPTNPERAAAYLSLAHTHDPTSEHLTQRLIRHHHTQHNPGAAHRAYTTHTHALAELDLQPHPDTTALLQQPPQTSGAS